MPVDFKLIPEKKLVSTRVYGPVTQKDLFDHLASMEDFFQDGTLDRTWMQLLHYDEMAYSGKAPLGLVRLLVKHNPWPIECPRVIVTESNLVYGMARMYQQLADPDGKGIRVMKSLEAGEDYLQACRLQRNL